MQADAEANNINEKTLKTGAVILACMLIGRGLGGSSDSLGNTSAVIAVTLSLCRHRVRHR